MAQGRRSSNSVLWTGQGKVQHGQGGEPGGEAGSGAAGQVAAQASTPRDASLPFLETFAYLETCWGAKNPQFPGATDRAACWPKCGSRVTPCGQVTLFRNLTGFLS